MADIEPYKQIKKTNIKEHNDLVAKINEIVDVINNTNLDTVGPKIAKLEQDVSAINATDALQWNDIESIKTKNIEQDNTLATHATEIDGVTKSLVSNVVLMNGTTTGNMKVRIECKDAPSIDSDDYNIQKPTSVELVQGSAPAMVKAQITLSDGTVLISDDFMFTTEAIGQDVYISSFVFKNGNVAGTISADIGLSNGTTLEANNFAVPTDPNVTSAITDLQSRMTAVEGGSVGGLDELKATVDSHTTSINQLDTDVADLMTDKVDVAQGISNAGKVLGINESGDVEPVIIKSDVKPIINPICRITKEATPYATGSPSYRYQPYPTSFTDNNAIMLYVWNASESMGGSILKSDPFTLSDSEIKDMLTQMNLHKLSDGSYEVGLMPYDTSGYGGWGDITVRTQIQFTVSNNIITISNLSSLQFYAIYGGQTTISNLTYVIQNISRLS